jgi:hypothetical protein
MLCEVFKLATLVVGLGEVELLELLEDSTQWFWEDNLHDLGCFHFLISMSAPFMTLFLLRRLGLSDVLIDRPCFLLKNSEINIDTLKVLLLLFELSCQLYRLVDVLEHLFDFLIELLAKLGFVLIDKFCFSFDIAIIHVDQPFCHQERVHLVKRVCGMQHTIETDSCWVLLLLARFTHI